MKKSKKPDLVVWSEERGYYPRELTYGSNLGAPSISIDDVQGWRQRGVTTSNSYFDSKFLEIKAQYEKYIEEFNWNQLIYKEAEYSFTPIVGHIYHLYQRDSGKLFLSIIEPKSWNMFHIGSFILDTTNKWNKIKN